MKFRKWKKPVNIEGWDFPRGHSIQKEVNRLEATVRNNYAESLQQQQIEVRQLVMDGLKQAKEGKTKDFNAVCDRLEKKYTDAEV